MMSRLPACLLAVAALLTPSLASADPIAIASVPIDFGLGFAPNFSFPAAGFEVTIHGTVHLFHNVPITEATIGQTLVANAATDGQFSAFAALATNGKPNITHFDFGPLGVASGSVGANSEALLFRLPRTAVDFNGFTLSSVQLRVNDVTLRTVNGTTSSALHGQLSVFGEGALKTVTPEPASVVLLSIGAIAAVVRRRRPQHG